MLLDVRDLDPDAQQNFIDRIFRIAEEDNEIFLRKFRDRIDTVGISLPTVEVRFQNLCVEADCHVGDRALPTLTNSARNIIEGLLAFVGISFSEKAKLGILKDASGILKPGRMALLMGPPSSGKTTLLLALAGRLDRGLRVDGEITYNGYKLNEFEPRRTAAYVSQHDLHQGELTVKETLDFSARCQGIGSRLDMLQELAKREKEAGIHPEAEVDLFMKATAIEGDRSSLITYYTLRILGLDVCRDTFVGDQMRRGISGGQKKRVTTGEMLVTSKKDQEQYWVDRNKPYRYIPVREFSQRFKNFHVGQKLHNELSVPYDKNESHKAALVFKKYLVPKMELLKACWDKEVLLMKRNTLIYVFKSFQIIFIAFIVTSLYFKPTMHHRNEMDGSIYIGAILCSMLINMFNGFADLSFAVMRLPVIYKQRDLMLHPPWTFTVPAFLLRIPVSLIESVIWTIIVYWGIGLAPDASR
nr:ABC transporter G family member 35-like [Tanacetum cinerariifolium]